MGCEAGKPPCLRQQVGNVRVRAGEADGALITDAIDEVAAAFGVAGPNVLTRQLRELLAQELRNHRRIRDHLTSGVLHAEHGWRSWPFTQPNINPRLCRDWCAAQVWRMSGRTCSTRGVLATARHDRGNRRPGPRKRNDLRRLSTGNAGPNAITACGSACGQPVRSLRMFRAPD